MGIKELEFILRTRYLLTNEINLWEERRGVKCHLMCNRIKENHFSWMESTVIL